MDSVDDKKIMVFCAVFFFWRRRQRRAAVDTRSVLLIIYLSSSNPLFSVCILANLRGVHMVLTLSFFLLACLLAEAKLACILLF